MGMPVIKPGTISRGDAIGDIIESVALEESALAHVLNAESEKLMSVVDHPDTTPNQLLSINQSVQSTISAITRLELQLKAKLEIFQKSICEK